METRTYQDPSNLDWGQLLQPGEENETGINEGIDEDQLGKERESEDQQEEEGREQQQGKKEAQSAWVEMETMKSYATPGQDQSKVDTYND